MLLLEFYKSSSILLRKSLVIFQRILVEEVIAQRLALHIEQFCVYVGLVDYSLALHVFSMPFLFARFIIFLLFSGECRALSLFNLLGVAEIAATVLQE